MAGGMPRETYVHRDELGLEKKLKDQLFLGHQIVCVTGPTKSGKSVLCRAVLDGVEALWIHGGQVRSESEFWEQAAEKLGLADEETSETHVSGGGRAGVPGLSAEGNAGRRRTAKGRTNSKTNVLAHCQNDSVTIVIDDFHYLDVKLQKSLIHSFKSEIFDGLTVILIAVPHRAFDTISVQREMEGRFANVEIPRWSEEDLQKIASLGFDALNADFPLARAERMAKESYGSPLLMQRFCLNICQQADLLVAEEERVSISIGSEALEGIFKEVAEQFGFPTYKKLSAGPQARSDRIQRQLSDGLGTVDIYQAVLLAVSKTGPKSEVHYNEIRDSLRSLLSDSDVPQKHEVSNALRNMSRIAREQIDGEPVLEWLDDSLYLTDPSLMFYMRWANKERGSG